MLVDMFVNNCLAVLADSVVAFALTCPTSNLCRSVFFVHMTKEIPGLTIIVIMNKHTTLLGGKKRKTKNLTATN